MSYHGIRSTYNFVSTAITLIWATTTACTAFFWRTLKNTFDVTWNAASLLQLVVSTTDSFRESFSEYITWQSILLVAVCLALAYERRARVVDFFEEHCLETYIVFRHHLYTYMYWLSSVQAFACMALLLILFGDAYQAFWTVGVCIVDLYFHESWNPQNLVVIKPVVTRTALVNGLLMGVRVVDGQDMYYLLQNAQTEMATRNSTQKVDPPKSLLNICVQRGDEFGIVGCASFGKTEGGSYLLLTAWHVIQDVETFIVRSVLRGKQKTLRTSDFSHVGDLAFYIVPPSFAADMGIVALNIARLETKGAVVINYSLDGQTCENSYGAVAKTKTRRVFSHQASTFCGSSGAPLTQNNCVVGVHGGSLDTNDGNWFTSLAILSSLPTRRGKPLTPYPHSESTYESLSGTATSYEDDDYDLDDLLGLRATSSRDRERFDQDARDLIDEAGEYWSSDTKVYREFEAMLLELENDGWSYHSTQGKAARAAFRARRHLESSFHPVDFRLTGEQPAKQVNLPQPEEPEMPQPQVPLKKIISYPREPRTRSTQSSKATFEKGFHSIQKTSPSEIPAKSESASSRRRARAKAQSLKAARSNKSETGSGLGTPSPDQLGH